MGTVNFKLDAESAKAVGAFLKVVDAQNKVTKATGKATRATKAQDGAMGRAGKRATKDLKSMVLKWGGVAAAIGVATKAITAQIAEAKRLEAQTAKATVSITKAIAGAGDLGVAGRVRGMIFQEGTTLAPQEGAQMYSAIRGAAPAAEFGRIKSLYGQAISAKKAGYYGGEAEDVGTALGTLGALLPGTTAGDVHDIAAYVMGAQGRHGRKISRGGYKAVRQMGALGIGGETSLGYLLAGVQTEQGASALQALAGRLGEQRTIAPAAFGRKETAGQIAMRRFYGTADATARLGMVQADPALRAQLFTTQTAAVEAMMGGAGGLTPAEHTRRIRLAQGRDYARLNREVAMADPAWRNYMANEEYRAAAEIAEYDSDLGRRGATMTRRGYQYRTAGVNPFLRSAYENLAEAKNALGFGDVDADLAAGEADVSAQKRALDLSTAREMNAAATNFRRASDRLPAHNAHGER